MKFLYRMHSHVVHSILFATILSVAVMFTGCSDSSTGSTDNNMNNNNNNNNNNNGGIGSEPTFTNVQMIFEQSCDGSTCHIGRRESGVRLDGYNNVINSVGTQYGTEVIQPGNADDSPLVDKIESDNPQFGESMPDGGLSLSTDRIIQIKEWIDQGANNN